MGCLRQTLPGGEWQSKIRARLDTRARSRYQTAPGQVQEEVSNSVVERGILLRAKCLHDELIALSAHGNSAVWPGTEESRLPRRVRLGRPLRAARWAFAGDDHARLGPF